ncbi:MAG: glycosyltransferase family 4 protein [Candidatus Krumholzibacteria bacterium]|nr:glycosyltransferase family 4 protein [Candidatus Krumholzibacteria bacterium]
MKIGAILPHLLLFGGVRRYIETGNVFVSRGHRFTLFTPDGVSADWTIFKGEVKPLSSLNEHDLDVLITGSPEFTGYLDASGAKLKIFYIQIEGVAREREITTSGKYNIMVNSKGLAERIRRKYSIPVIDGTGGVDPAIFYPLGDPREEMDDRLPGSCPVGVICYGRRSRPRKGTRFVIDAVRRLRRKGFDIRLHLFDHRTTEEEDSRVGFDPGLPFVYYLDLSQERMAAMYGSSNIFVSAERRAGWSNTSAEAAACALPIVCTKSGTSDFAVDGSSALVVPWRNHRPISRAIERLILDPGMAVRLGIEARRRIMDFTWERVCDRMESGFVRLLEE